jgi:hypothetical protein
LLKKQLVLEDDGLEPSSAKEKSNSLPAVSPPKGHGPHEFAHLRLGSEIRQLQGDPLPSPNTLERIHRAELRKKEEKILELQETIDANKERFDEFQTQLDSFGSVQDVSNLYKEIAHLKRAKDDSRKIGTFTKLEGSYGAAREEMHMETQVPTIRRLMKNILGCCDDDTTLKVPGPEVSLGLRLLLSFGFGFGLDDQTPFGNEHFKLLVSNRPPYSIIETLVEAAVCIWVFESSFPDFDQGPVALNLLTKYRDLIAAQG